MGRRNSGSQSGRFPDEEQWDGEIQEASQEDFLIKSRGAVKCRKRGGRFPDRQLGFDEHQEQSRVKTLTNLEGGLVRGKKACFPGGSPANCPIK